MKGTARMTVLRVKSADAEAYYKGARYIDWRKIPLKIGKVYALFEEEKGKITGRIFATLVVSGEASAVARVMSSIGMLKLDGLSYKEAMTRAGGSCKGASASIVCAVPMGSAIDCPTTFGKRDRMDMYFTVKNGDAGK